jgi:hypothetical protein
MWQKTTALFEVENLSEIEKTVSDLLDAKGDFVRTPFNMDLVSIRAIFVSTGDNLNDDTFLPTETYIALNSIPNKPANLNHNNDTIVGHIYNAEILNDSKTIAGATSARDMLHFGETTPEHGHTHTWTLDVDESGNVKGGWTSWDNGHRHYLNVETLKDKQTTPALPDGHSHTLEGLPAGFEGMPLLANESLDIPDNFDIAVDIYLYAFQLPKLIAAIRDAAEAGKKFVSMEAFFNDYDYKVGDKIIARNTETAFLDGHLRVNGGTGKFNNIKVTRALRNILFGGVGFVDKPANPGSIILSVASDDKKDISLQEKNKMLEAVAKNCVLIDDRNNTDNLPEQKVIAEEKKMSEIDNEQIVALKLELAEAQKTIEGLRDARAEADFADQKADLEQKVSAATADIAEKVSAIAELTQKVEELTKGCDVLRAERDELQDKLVAARLESRRADFAKFDIGADDLEEILAEVRDLEQADYDKYLSRANRLFKIKSAEHGDMPADMKKKKEEEEAKKAKSAIEDFEKAQASPVGEVFNGDSSDLYSEVASVFEGLFNKESK